MMRTAATVSILTGFSLFWLTLLGPMASFPARAADYKPGVMTASGKPTGRFIIKLRTDAESAQLPTGQNAHLSESMDALAIRAGAPFVRSRALAPRVQVVAMLTVPAADTEAALLERLRSDPEVAWAERDERRYALSVPTDADYAQQWYLQPPTTNLLAAIDAQSAWSMTTGSSGIVIGQLDTGVRFDHPDLLRAQNGGRLLPGYDFVGSDGGDTNSSTATYLTANDSDGWDPDAADPGDWIASGDPILKIDTSCLPSGTTSEASSWHGTRTAGILGALSNNGIGIAGTTWQGWVLPVRVLGKCGGYDSDIITGMQWAVGMTVVDVNNQAIPVNPFPAQILNLSLGGTGSCPAQYADIIPKLMTRGVLVVASAGNEGGPVDAPANCPGVVGVAGLRAAGTKVGYSSLGPEVSLAAPAGNCGQSSGNCLYEIHTTLNLGSTTPGSNGYTDQINNPNLGTSFSAPLVAGTAALMLAANHNLTPAQLTARLKSSATAFPTTSIDATTQPSTCHTPASSSDLQTSECICTTAVCGAGMLNAAQAVQAALAPIAVVQLPTNVSAGASVTISAAQSTASCNHQIASFQWRSGNTILGTGSSLTLAAPASGNTTLTLVVTDDQALTDTVSITLGSSSVSAVSTSTGATPPTSPGTAACATALTTDAPLATASLNGPSSAAVGSAFSLSWSSSNANICEGSGGSSADKWVTTLATSGTQSVTESTPGTYTFGLACYGSTVSPTTTATVTVAYQPTVALSASPSSAQSGSSITLSWSSTHATSCSASGGSSTDGWAGSSISASGTKSLSESTAGSYSYTVSCVNGPLSAQASASATITAPSSGGGGGGGDIDAAMLAVLGLLLLLMRRLQLPYDSSTRANASFRC